MKDEPTASHCDAPVQLTPFSIAAPAFDGAGAAWSDQLVPFQRSASGTSTPLLLKESPTASQVKLAVPLHAMPSSTLLVAPMGFGVACTDQVAPFQCSASVKATPEPLLWLPTAKHSVVEGQATLENASARGELLLGSAVGCTTHVLTAATSAGPAAPSTSTASSAARTPQRGNRHLLIDR